MKINKQFYKDINFYLYLIFILLWINPLREASNIYEIIVCSLFMIVAIIASLHTLFKK